MGWLTAILGALPSLIQGIAAFQQKRAALMALQAATNQQTVADDNAELARRVTQEATTARARVVPSPIESAPAVAVSVPAKSTPYGDE